MAAREAPLENRTWVYVWILVGIVAFLYSMFWGFHLIPLIQNSAKVPADGKTALFNGVVINVFFVLFCACAWLAATTHPGRPSEEWSSYEFASQFVQERKRKSGFRYCHEKSCKNYKPDRCHHCRKLGVCVLRMDHYCPWINNTLGANNQKYFFLTLFYGMMLLDCYVVFMWPRFVHGTKALDYLKQDFLVMFAWFFSVMLGGLITWFFLFHCRLCANAYTTIEHCEKKRAKPELKWRVGVGASLADVYASSPWDQGWYLNVTEVLGPNPLLWLVPVYTPTMSPGVDFSKKMNRNHPMFRATPREKTDRR